MDYIKKTWADPVWSNVIAGIIILVISGFSFKSFWTTLKEFLTLKIDVWVMALMALVIVVICVISFRLKRKPTNTKPSLNIQFTKYIGVYQVYHFAPHTTGTPKMTQSFLQIDPNKTQYVHNLFECQDGEIEHIEGHIFLNLKNKEQKNAPFYFILKSINDAKIIYLGGICVGIGQNQNCHPIAVKVALVKRDGITDFSVEKYKSHCSIEEFPKEKLQDYPYDKLVPEFLWNKCEDKDILF
ncbi:MAG: hypothetical protein QM535_18860 [Limnohabitans sp.]|nr:hypothetical protein [Limnohabitans sp.]